MSDDTRDLAQRIRDALRDAALEDDPYYAAKFTEWVYNREASKVMVKGEKDVDVCDVVYDCDGLLIAAAPTLLRDALARIEADAATIAALRKRVEQFETYANTLGRIIDPYDATTFTPGNQIRLYDFYDAPKEWRDLSTHGGDEDFLIYIPQAQRESYLADKLKTEGSLGRWFVSEQELPDGALIVIHAHA